MIKIIFVWICSVSFIGMWYILSTHTLTPTLCVLCLRLAILSSPILLLAVTLLPVLHRRHGRVFFIITGIHCVSIKLIGKKMEYITILSQYFLEWSDWWTVTIYKLYQEQCNSSFGYSQMAPSGWVRSVRLVSGSAALMFFVSVLQRLVCEQHSGISWIHYSPASLVPLKQKAPKIS